LFRERWGSKAKKNGGDGTCDTERSHRRNAEEREAAKKVFIFIGTRSDQRGKSASLRRGP